MEDSSKLLRKIIFTLAVLVCLVPISLQINQSIEASEYMTEDDWNESFKLSYGSSLPDFYGLGEEGFQGRWLNAKEEASLDCNFSKHCVFMKLATIAECEKGVVVEFLVFDKDEKQIAHEQTPVFLIKTGQYVDVELGSKKLTEKGFIEPIDAYCSDTQPYV